MRIPTVSIILPTYNGKTKRLSQSIDSVLAQTYQYRELIIINDASTNDIEKTILEYVPRDKRIKYYKNKENLKLTKTLNIWIQYSEWSYIARIDDDDIWCDPKKLEKQVQCMEDNKEFWLCGTCGYIIDEDDQIRESFIQRQHDNDIRKHLLASNQFAHCSVLIRRSAIEKLWMYHPQYNLVEDYELWLRIWVEYKLYNLPDKAVYYRINTCSVSSKNYRKQLILNMQVMRLYRSQYPNFYVAFLKNIVYFVLPKKLSLYFLKIYKNLFH